MDVFTLVGKISMEGIDKVNGQLDGIKGKLTGVGDNMKSVGKGMTKAGGVMVGAVSAIAIPSLKMAIDFESAFAGVRKTVDATEEEFLKLDTDLREMTKHLPVTYVELARIAESAGQLGIKKEDITSFTETIAKLGMASNLTGEEGATSLARFMNITGMAKDDIDKLGSVIVALGNNSATTEAEIVDMAMRLAGAGHAVGMTETEIMALSAALSSMGLRSEAGGTAFSRVMLEMNSAVAAGGEKLETFATAAGMTVEEFKNLFEEDATGAVMAFISGLGDLKSEGKDITPVLDDLGLGGIRITDTLLRATGAQDLLTDSQELAAKAWEENIALNEEVAKRQETTASKMALLKNEMALTAEVIGTALVPVLEDIMEAVKPIIEKIAAWVKENPELVKTILVVVGAVGGLLLTLGPILMVVGSLLTVLPALFGAFAAISGVFAGLSLAAGPLGVAIAVITGPIGLVIAAIAAAIAIGILIYKNWDTIKEKAGELWQHISGVFTNMKNFFVNIWDKITGIFREHWDKILMILFPAIGLPILIAKNWGPITEAVKGIWNRIKEVFSGIWETAKNWGLDLVKGLWEGIASLSSWIWDKVTGFAKGIFDSVKEGFGKLWPFSPSEAGVDIGEGLARGIEVGVKGSLKNIRSAMQGMTDEMSIGSGGIRSAGGVEPSLASPSETTVITQHFEGPWYIREEADIQKIARELYRLQRSKGVLVGS